jgi:hypothetical protein
LRVAGMQSESESNTCRNKCPVIDVADSVFRFKVQEQFFREFEINTAAKFNAKFVAGIFILV